MTGYITLDFTIKLHSKKSESWGQLFRGEKEPTKVESELTFIFLRVRVWTWACKAELKSIWRSNWCQHAKCELRCWKTFLRLRELPGAPEVGAGQMKDDSCSVETVSCSVGSPGGKPVWVACRMGAGMWGQDRGLGGALSNPLSRRIQGQRQPGQLPDIIQESEALRRCPANAVSEQGLICLPEYGLWILILGNGLFTDT